MLILIGSRGLANLGFDIGRKPVDYDYIGHYSDIMEHINTISKTSKIISIYPTKNNKLLLKTADCVHEFEIAWDGSTGDEFLSLVKKDGMSLNLLYHLKLSHRYLKNSPHFIKTMRDIQMMRKYGASYDQYFDGWFKRRESETLKRKHIKLNVSKNAFFNHKTVKYVYDHDTIHLAMKHLDKPAYEFFKTGEVFCDKKSFFESDNIIRLYSVLEEIQVLAIERCVIHNPECDYKRSFDIAHQRVCTSISSGWWREFAYENYDAVQAMYEPDYVYKFWKAVESGIVKFVK